MGKGVNMQNKTTVTTLKTHNQENFNAESDRVDSIMFRDGVDHDHNGELVHVDTAWALGFTEKESV
jgi:hypothetical protein